MYSAIILINNEKTKTNTIWEKHSAMEGVTELYSVRGSFDLVAIIRLRNNDDLSELITEKIAQIEGIVKTETMVAFRVLSKHDIENMFDLGSWST